MIDQVALVAGATFLLGIAVGLGKLSARVDHLEENARDTRDDIRRIRETTDDIARAFRPQR